MPPRALRWRAAVAWLAGIATSLLSNAGAITITSIEACDALVVTGLAYGLLCATSRRADGQLVS